MPRISSFFGITIVMYFDESRHPGRPHFHALYGEYEATFEIREIELMAGKCPTRVRRLVVRWARAHQEELETNWELARQGKQPKPIEPLR